jgi:two-component system LytT family sensor kinase
MTAHRKISMEDLVKPGWRSLLLTLGIWYLLVTIYMSMGSSSRSAIEIYLFYTRYSWPNFIICYLNIVWLIPRFLHTRKVAAYLTTATITLAVYVCIRYYNHILQDPDMYTYFTRSGSELVRKSLSISEIVKAELLKGFQFLLLSLAYRSILDRVITERRISGLEREKLRADLAMLRYQLNPHFLFNTINDIYYLALIRSTDTANALLELSELLRYVLHSKDDKVALEREIDHLRRFIKLHRFRFPDCIVKLDIDTGPEPEQWVIPPLVLISFTENAFKHGEQGTETDPVEIIIRIQKDRLHYLVRNVIGKSSSKDAHNGVGLPNLRNRMALMFPDNYTIESRQTEDGHFVATLDIPLQHP